MSFRLGLLTVALVAARFFVWSDVAHAGTASRSDEIVIGLIVPLAGPDAAAGREASCGSEAAVRRAQHEGGTQGRHIRLITAASRNPWDDAARQVARLIHEEGAVVVVGAIDAATAHAAEQVIVRERGAAAFISLWASESALTQLPVPWYFSAVPEDRLQGRALAREIFEVRGARGAAVYADGSREGRSLAAAFEAAAPAGAVVRLAAEDPAALDRIVAEIAAGRVQAVVLAVSPGEAARAAAVLGRRSPGVGLFGPLRLATPAFGRPVPPMAPEKAAAAQLDGMSAQAGAERMPSSEPGSVFVPWPGVTDAAARAALEEACPEVTPLAMYAYDAVTAGVAASRARRGGPRLPLERHLAAIAVAGATGPVRFDATRSRADMPPWRAMAPSSHGAGGPAAGTGAGASGRRPVL